MLVGKIKKIENVTENFIGFASIVEMVDSYFFEKPNLRTLI